MASVEDIEIREFAPGDGPGIVGLLNEVFEEGDPNYVPRTLAQWSWVYDQNPAGRQVVVAVEPGGRIVGHYACIPYAATVAGREVVCGQGVDSMVSPEYRRGLQAEGLFLRTARKFFETFGVPERSAFGYGFPNRKAFRIGVRLLGYLPVHAPVVTLGRNLFDTTEDGVVAAGADPTGEIVAVPRFGAAMDGLWSRLLPEIGMGIQRDARYLNWRYTDCPFGRYEAFALVDPDGSWRGACIARRQWAGAPILSLSEFLVPAGDPGAAIRLLAHTVGHARAVGQQRVECWFPPQHPLHQLAADHGFRAEDSPFHLCVKIYDPSIDAGWARDQWFFGMGDTDVF